MTAPELEEVWCSQCDQPAIADFRVRGTLIALCGDHVSQRWPWEYVPRPVAEETESEKREAWGK